MVFAITTVMVVTGFNAKYKHHQSTDILKIEYSDAFEYIPTTAQRSTHAIANFVAKHRSDPPVVLDGPGIAALTGRMGDTREYSFDLPRSATATFHLFYWPIWQLSLNCDPIATSPVDFGRMTASIPAGKHHASITRTTDVIETIGGWVSAATLLLLAGLVMTSAFRTDAP